MSSNPWWPGRPSDSDLNQSVPPFGEELVSPPPPPPPAPPADADSRVWRISSRGFLQRRRKRERLWFFRENFGSEIMFCCRGVVQRWCVAVFLLCSPLPLHGRPVDSVSRTRRSVSHAQLMHDKGRTLQDFKRRLWLQELLEEIHTARIRDLLTEGGASSTVVLSPSAGGSSHPKLGGGSKYLPLSFSPEEEEELPQETQKELPYRGGRKRKRGRGGRRKEGEKKRRRARSPPPLQDGEEESSGFRPLLRLEEELL